MVVYFTRREVILGAASLATAGAGVTTAVLGLNDSVEGQADVEAEQALIVTGINIYGDADASFTRLSDDNTEFQAAVELNNGDEVRFDATVRNNAADDLDVEIQVDSPDVIDIAVAENSNPTRGAGTDNDANVDDANAADGAIRVGEATWIAGVDATDSGDTEEDINIAAELDDTASPGSYDIGAAINPLSTDN